MADGRWVMTNEELNNVVCTMNERTADQLPNYRKHLQVDNRDDNAAKICAFCGSNNITSGFGGYGEGFGYLSSRCEDCGGTTDFVYQDDVGKYFK